MAYEIKRFEFSGTVDADGHILEPPELWETYLPARFKERAMRIALDGDGYEVLEIDGRPSRRSRRGSLGLLGAMGDEDQKPRADRRYKDSMPFGACDAAERLSLLDQENLEASLLYPTLGLLWEWELTDPELSLAYCQAYNRWIADFCRDSGNRLIPIAHLTLLDPEGSAQELERAVRDGCKGAWVNPFNHNRTLHGHVDHDVLHAKCVELDVPLAIHPTFTPHDKPAEGIFDWPRGRDPLRLTLVAKYRPAGLRFLYRVGYVGSLSGSAPRNSGSRIGLGRCDARSNGCGDRGVAAHLDKRPVRQRLFSSTMFRLR